MWPFKKKKYDFSKDEDLEEMDRVNTVVEKLKEGATTTEELKIKMGLYLPGIALTKQLAKAKAMGEVVKNVDDKTIEKGEKLLELFNKGQEANDKRLLK